MTNIAQQKTDYCIALADDALILGQRLSEWCSNAPFLEEELALANVALDMIGRANLFYEYAATIDAAGRSADQLAFGRDCRDYTNLLINELPKGDFAFTMARQFLVDAFNVEFLQKLQRSTDKHIAGVAEKALKESLYHLRRSRAWVVRLGDGTAESHERIQKAFDDLWAYVPELFQVSASEAALLDEGIAVDRSALRPAWDQVIDATLGEGRLQRPDESREISGGRAGIHTEHLGYLLAEMQFLQRTYPNLEW